MAAGKEIRSKIGSVRSTQKITSAMEMVAASKMRRTQQQMFEGAPYASKIRNVIGHLARAFPEHRNDFMGKRDVQRAGYLVISTDKGLCGGLNVNLFRSLIRDMKRKHDEGIEIDIGLIGRKAQIFFRSFGGNVIAAVGEVGEHPVPEDLVGSVKIMFDAFEEHRIDVLYVATNRFVNTMTQSPLIQQLLPLPELTTDRVISAARWDYIYEPDAKDLVEGLVRRYIESQIYQAVVENVACEQAAKMVAMKNATDNAGELIEELQLLYNNVRQASITQEISEIIGGAAAV